MADRSMQQLKARMEELALLEKAVHGPAWTPDPAMNYEQRVLGLLKQVIIHIGTLEQAQNGLAIAFRNMAQAQVPKRPGLILPGS